MEKYGSCPSLIELPDLVIDKILLDLPLSDLKNLRWTCSALKVIVEQHPAFYQRIRISINSDNFQHLQNTLLDEKVFTNIKVDLDSSHLDSAPFLSILQCNQLSIRSIRLVGLPYKIIPLDFLSLPTAVRDLEFEGSWALANFKPEAILEPNKFNAESVESLVINASTDACGFHNFNNFGEFLALFPALRRIKLYSRFANAVQPLLYRQLVRVFLNRCDLLESIDLQDFIRNSETRYLPTCKLLCDFCCELELRFPEPKEIIKTKDATETENQFLECVVGLSTHAVGNNVTFPFHRLTNLSWVRINLHRFNYPESFGPALREGVQQEPFVSLKKLYLSLFSDYNLFELRKAKDIFARNGKEIEELVLDLPLDSNVKVAERDESVTSFFSVFTNLKVLQIHNWFSPVWVLPQNLDKLELCNVMK